SPFPQAVTSDANPGSRQRGIEEASPAHAHLAFLTARRWEASLHVPEEQFPALTAEVVQVADVVAIAIDVIENDAAGRGPLDVLSQVPRREAAHAPVRLHRPIHSPKAFLCDDDALDNGHEIAPLQVLFNELPVFDGQLRRIDDQPCFLVRVVAYTQE